jgi:hypothetical protein
MATPEAAGTWAALAALRDLDAARHARVLAFVHELAELRGGPRGRLSRLLDPAAAIERELAAR